MLYKHVADRRADIENINRANVLLYLQHKAEDYLKDPNNITALVEELGHNQHKEIYPSEMGAGSNFDGRYIVGIRREDEENKPVLKAMIIDTVHTGSDLRAAKVAELIGISAGIYTAVDPDAAWGINGIWSEPLSRYFDTTNIPTGAVAITTEYNKAKYRVNISDILVDADLDMGEFEVTAEQINAVAIAAQNGTLDQLIAQDVTSQNVNATTEVTSPKVSATERFCFKKENGTEDCIESWEGLGGGGGEGEAEKASDLQLVQECNAGMSESCAQAFIKDLNTSCSKVDALYDELGVPYPNPKLYRLTYGSGVYAGDVVTRCDGTSFVVNNISTQSLSNPVEQVGDSAFGITTPGWYNIVLKGEANSNNDGSSSTAGGIVVANVHYDVDTLLILKGIQGGMSDSTNFGGAGVALWDTINTTGTPTLVAGGGGGTSAGGGGYAGGNSTQKGYGWNGVEGGNTYFCAAGGCNNGATGGRYSTSSYGGSGTGVSGYSCPAGYTCVATSGASVVASNTIEYFTYNPTNYGNWTASHSDAFGYASITYCGSSELDCPILCNRDSDCSGDTPDCNKGFCSAPTTCTGNADCKVVTRPYCTNNQCSDSPAPGTTVYSKTVSLSGSGVSLLDTIQVVGKYKFDLRGGKPPYSGGLAYGNGGTWIATKTFGSRTILQTKKVSYHSVAPMLYEGTALALVAGGGGWIKASETYSSDDGWSRYIYFYGGSGYAGGGVSASPTSSYYTLRSYSGYSYNGSKGSSTATSGAGGGSAATLSAGSPYWWSGSAYGGTGYCRSGYSCTGTYATWGSNAYIAITYCGPDANSTCP